MSRKLVRYRTTRIPEADFLAMHSAYALIERSEGDFRFVRRCRSRDFGVGDLIGPAPAKTGNPAQSP